MPSEIRRGQQEVLKRKRISAEVSVPYCVCTRDADIESRMERATPYLILVTEESTAKTHSTKCLNSPFRVSGSLFNSVTVHAPKRKPATVGKYGILQNLLKPISKSSISKP